MSLDKAAGEVDAALTRTEKTGLGYENVFAGVTSFLRRRLTKDLSGFDLAVTGVPFDQAVTNRPGARFGPRAIREASAGMAGDPPYGWGFSPLDEFAIADYGDMAFDYAKPFEVPKLIEAHIGGILDAGTDCIALGGDHSTTLASLRAHVARRGPVALLQFDAHPDTWLDDDPARVDHGTFVYKAVREGLIDPDHSLQVGTRIDVEDEPDLGLMRIGADRVHSEGPEAVAAQIRARIGDAPTYLTFDIDAFDPAFAPGTGTPVWGGLTSPQVRAILRQMAGITMVGADVVEVSPPFDHAGVTALMGAHVAYELISIWAWNRRAA